MIDHQLIKDFVFLCAHTGLVFSVGAYWGLKTYQRKQARNEATS